MKGHSYNECKCGKQHIRPRGMSGKQHSEKNKQLFSKIKKGHNHAWLKGKSIPESMKASISDSLKKKYSKTPIHFKGKSISDEQKKKISLATSGKNNPNFINGIYASRDHNRIYRHQKKVNPDKMKARIDLKNAVKSGKVKKPKICQECKVSCNPDGHHSDYSKPLEVNWLCKSCHKSAHGGAFVSK